MSGHATTLAVFAAVFFLTIGTGAVASRWRSKGEGLEGWGLGGRQFGTLVTWFLVGGDFYTAYTIIAVPALVFSTGGYGFFALPYTIIVYPFVFVAMPRLWSVCRAHGLITAADFVHVRYGSRALASAVALTGIVAVMPYIALQLVGIETLLSQLGFAKGPGAWTGVPIVLAFACVAFFSYSSGLRAPALIAFAKDTMIYIVVLAAVIVLPLRFGGFQHLFDAAAAGYAHVGHAGALLPAHQDYSAYATLALGSALAAFMYPHTITSVLASSSSNVIRRNAVLLPAYTFLLGLIALLGIVGVAAGLHPHSPKDIVPALLQSAFPPWFTGFCFAAIAVAALVPASIMSIAAANLFTRNIFGEFRKGKLSAEREPLVAKRFSLLVNFCALLFTFLMPSQYAVNFQLLGGIWILQTFPAIVLGLWRRFFHQDALLAGWAVGTLCGTLLAAHLRLQSAVTILPIGADGLRVYIGVVALGINLAVAAASTALFDRIGRRRLQDATVAADYLSAE